MTTTAVPIAKRASQVERGIADEELSLAMRAAYAKRLSRQAIAPLDTAQDTARVGPVANPPWRCHAESAP
jgi:hypothetical protein